MLVRVAFKKIQSKKSTNCSKKGDSMKQVGKIYESQIQRAIFDWAKYKPELKWLFHIPNGGSRNMLEAVHLKQQGVKKGVSDMFLPIPKNNYHGLFIELKAGKNKPSKEQLEFIDYVSKQGYKAVVCYGLDETIKVIEEYLK